MTRQVTAMALEWLLTAGWPCLWHHPSRKLHLARQRPRASSESKDIDVSVVAPGVDVGLAAVFMHRQALD